MASWPVNIGILYIYNIIKYRLDFNSLLLLVGILSLSILKNHIAKNILGWKGETLLPDLTKLSRHMALLLF